MRVTTHGMMRVTLSDSIVPIQPGPGFPMAYLLASRNSFRLAFPQPDPRDARGAACVLSRRCWQDGSFHYSYVQASLVFSFFAIISACRTACFRSGYEPALDVFLCVSCFLRPCFGSAPRSRDHFLTMESDPILLNAPCFGQAGTSLRLWISANSEHLTDL